MRPWQFSRPKGPGFGISADYYLTIFAPVPYLPPILQLINPKGEGGAVEGFGAPLSAASKEALAQPMGRGAYALASPDRKTVLKFLVLHVDEAGFDAQTFAQSDLAATLDPDLVARVRGAWFSLQMAFEIHDPAVYPAVRFFLRIARRAAELADGAIADPISQRYLLPQDLVLPGTTDFKVDVRDVVTVRFRERPDGYHCFTLGMQKFGLPELEVYGCDQEVEPLAVRFLLGACQAILAGKPLKDGAKIGAPGMPLEVRPGGLEPQFWRGVECFELLPPTHNTASEALIAWGAVAEDDQSVL